MMELDKIKQLVESIGIKLCSQAKASSNSSNLGFSGFISFVWRLFSHFTKSSNIYIIVVFLKF